MNTTSLNGASFSADESKLLFSSNKTGIFNVYTVPVTGGEPTAITASTTDSTYAVSYFRNDDRMLFTRDQGGNELNHLYVRTPDGQERDLTPGAKLKAQFSGWAPDGSAFYVGTNERDPRYFDLYRYDAKTYERTLVLQERAGLLPGLRVGRREVGRADEGEHDVGLRHLSVERATRRRRRTSPRTRAWRRIRPRRSIARSTQLYYLTDDGSEFARLRRYDLAKKTHEDVQKAAWDIVFTSFSRNGPLSRHRGERRRPRRHHDPRHEDRTRPVKLPAIPDGGALGGVTIGPRREAAGVLRERRPRAEQPLRPRLRRHGADAADRTR